MFCLICYTVLDNNYPKFICSCSFCVDCLSNWILSEIDSLSFSLENQKIRCPNSNCYNAHQLDELKNKLNNIDALSNIESALAIKYCQKSSDIRSCPNSECKNFGFLPKKCNFELECNMCNYKWEEYDNFTIFKKTKLFLNSTISFNFTFNFLSYSYEELFTNNCPSCQIPISKNGGCMHMTCLKCQYQFCWYCKKYWMKHNRFFCISNVLGSFSLFLFMYLLILNNLGFLSIISNFLIYISPGIRYFFIIFIYFDGVILGTIFQLFTEINYVKNNKKYETWQRKIIPSLIICLIVISLFGSLIIFDLLWYFVKVILVEFLLCMIGLSITILGSCVLTWISNVI